MERMDKKVEVVFNRLGMTCGYCGGVEFPSRLDYKEVYGETNGKLEEADIDFAMSQIKFPDPVCPSAGCHASVDTSVAKDVLQIAARLGEARRSGDFRPASEVVEVTSDWPEEITLEKGSPTDQLMDDLDGAAEQTFSRTEPLGREELSIMVNVDLTSPDMDGYFESYVALWLEYRERNRQK